jgi:hypothetical protein
MADRERWATRAQRKPTVCGGIFGIDSHRLLGRRAIVLLAELQMCRPVTARLRGGIVQSFRVRYPSDTFKTFSHPIVRGTMHQNVAL